MEEMRGRKERVASWRDDDRSSLYCRSKKCVLKKGGIIVCISQTMEDNWKGGR